MSARTVAAWLYNKIDITNRAIPNNQGICLTTSSIEDFNSAMLPCKKVSPIQAIPKMATTACIPAPKTEPCAAFNPSVRVINNMIAAADNINISMIDGISNNTCSPLIMNEGRMVSNEPNSTINTVAIMKTKTDRLALLWLATSFSSYFLSLNTPSFKRF